MQTKVGSASQVEAFQYVADNLDEKVKFVSVLETLQKHNSEYLYFKTDHHWTADGAYYAYKQLMKAKGVKPCSLDAYSKKEYTGFLGSFYASSNQSEILANNTDTVVAYVPQVNEMTYTDANGQEQQGAVVADADSYSGTALTAYVKDNKIEDVIFLNTANAINTSAVNLMYSVW